MKKDKFTKIKQTGPRDIALLRSQLLTLNPYIKGNNTLSKRRKYLYEMIAKSAVVHFTSIKKSKVSLVDYTHLDLFKKCKEEQFQNHFESAFANINKSFRKTTYWTTEGKLGESYLEVKGSETPSKTVHYSVSPEEILKIQNQVFSKAAYSSTGKSATYKKDLGLYSNKNYKVETIDEFKARGGKVKKCRSSHKSRAFIKRLWNTL